MDKSLLRGGRCSRNPNSRSYCPSPKQQRRILACRKQEEKLHQLLPVLGGAIHLCVRLLKLKVREIQDLGVHRRSPDAAAYCRSLQARARSMEKLARVLQPPSAGGPANGSVFGKDARDAMRVIVHKLHSVLVKLKRALQHTKGCRKLHSLRKHATSAWRSGRSILRDMKRDHKDGL